MNRKLKEKINESLSSVIPITLIVLILSIFIVPMSISTIVMFLAGAALLVLGMGLFSLGADISMKPMGEGVGEELTKMDKVGLVALIAFVLGFIITLAEPDLGVLAGQVASIPNQVLIVTVSIGVGVFLALSVLRIIFRIPLNWLLFVCYMAVFALSFFVPKDFLSVAFDSGGVTTGPITVPFILALGVGVSASRSDKSAGDDSFGLVALSSIGPILAVMILGIVYNPQETTYEQVVIPELATMQDVAHEFAVELPSFMREVLVALVPVCLFFVAFQWATRTFSKRSLARIGVGLIYTYAGLVLFLTGVNVGFIPVGNLLGAELAGGYKWLLVPMGMLIGYFIVAAEPAIHVLNRQVEDVSGGAISSKAMNVCLSIGVALSVGLAMVRVLTGLPILWLLVPGYAIALILSFIVPPIFTGIAFDSGGVASGPMTTTFLLPFAMGACEALGGNIMTDAFGIVAMVAMTPLIAVQLMGLVYSIKARKADAEDADEEAELLALSDGEEGDLDESMGTA